MLSRSELTNLQDHRDYPSVSILVPTHRTAPANRKDRIVVKNLVKQALVRLHNEFKSREVAAVVQNLEKLVRQVDWEHTLDGLALFASRNRAATVLLPFRVKARAVIDATFATRDLVFTLNRAPGYRTLVLSEKRTRLYEASTTVLSEYTAKPFPMVHGGPGGAARLPGGRGINPSAVRDERHRQFFCAVDDAVAALQKANRLALVVVGVERYLAFYQEVSRQPEAIVGMLAGNHDQTSPTALGKLVWPVFQSGATLRRTQALVQLDEAVSARGSTRSGAPRTKNGAGPCWSRPTSNTRPT